MRRPLPLLFVGLLQNLNEGTLSSPPGDYAAAVSTLLGWEAPGPPDALADWWIAELDKHHVARAALIASIPGDEESVAAAIARHPSRLVGFFMLNPSTADAAERLSRALDDWKLRGICLFPAMHHYQMTDERVTATFEAAAARGAAVFVHCGVLTVGVRKKLGLASPFNLRLGDPLALATVAARFPKVPVIIPHFGAGFLREALMAANQCRTSTWTRRAAIRGSRTIPTSRSRTSSDRRWPWSAPSGCCSARTRRSSRAAGSAGLRAAEADPRTAGRSGRRAGEYLLGQLPTAV